METCKDEATMWNRKRKWRTRNWNANCIKCAKNIFRKNLILTLSKLCEKWFSDWLNICAPSTGQSIINLASIQLIELNLEIKQLLRSMLKRVECCATCDNEKKKKKLDAWTVQQRCSTFSLNWSFYDSPKLLNRLSCHKIRFFAELVLWPSSHLISINPKRSEFLICSPWTCSMASL